jgi:hypothetical protein
VVGYAGRSRRRGDDRSAGEHDRDEPPHLL